MSKKSFERVLLIGVERMSRRTAKGSVSDPEPPWPTCAFLFHQPKRPMIR
ncbi:MAG: hypothetical protein K5745_06215 [Saccharofermentans sp.]|nr:hypothetical protein [Saccharofermentans sp.]